MHKAMLKHLSQLVGQTVTKIICDPDDDIGTVYGFQTHTGMTVWVLQDPEGNGPGHLEIVKGK